MAKRLNKKVVFIGTVFLILAGFAAIAVMFHFNQDPTKLIVSGDEYFKSAMEQEDSELASEDFAKAAHCYLKARQKLEDDSARVEILYKLVKVYMQTKAWDNILGCWAKIAQLDPEDYESRLSQLNYFYILADNGAQQAWKGIVSQISDFQEIVDETKLGNKVSDFNAYGAEDVDFAESLRCYLFGMMGRAELEIAKSGATTDVEESYNNAISSLNKAIEYELSNVDCRYYLAQALIGKGDVYAGKNDIVSRDGFRAEAKMQLEKAVEMSADDAQSHINLLSLRPLLEGYDSFEQMESLEPDYILLAEKFTDSSLVHSTLSNYYGLIGTAKIDKAIDSIDKAVSLEPKNIMYRLSAMSEYVLRYNIKGDMSDYDKAVSLAEETLGLPDCREVKGPYKWANKLNRIRVNFFLIDVYLDRVLEAKWAGENIEAQKEELISKSEQVLSRLEQLLGSSDDPQYIKWSNVLELAKGNEAEAIAELYSIYEQLKASDKMDSKLFYILGKEFMNKPEVGAAAEFLSSALSLNNRNVVDRIDKTKPGAIIDYAEVLERVEAYEPAYSVLGFYEKSFGVSFRSDMLKAKCLIGLSRYEEAAEILDRHDQNSEVMSMRSDIIVSQIRKLRLALSNIRMSGDNVLAKESGSGDTAEIKALESEIDGYIVKLAELIEKQLGVAPESVLVDTVTQVCNSYIYGGQIEKARDLIGKVLEEFPDNTIFKSYSKILESSDLQWEAGSEQLKAVERKVLFGIADMVQREFSLGQFYMRTGQLVEAKESLRKVLSSQLEQRDEGIDTLSPQENRALGSLFDVATQTEDFELAEELLNIVKVHDFDECGGSFFEANLLYAQKDYENALGLINKCVEKRPLFSHGYALRSNVHSALGNDMEAIADARRANQLNPLDRNIAKGLAIVLLKRVQQLRGDAPADLLSETKTAFLLAIKHNPQELSLQGLYSELISSDDPQRAMAIRQSLLKMDPTVDNAVMLGRMGARLGSGAEIAEEQKVYFEIAEKAFEKALQIEPGNQSVIENIVQYYRLSGQEQKAEEFLAGLGDEGTFWRLYVQGGKYEEAKAILEKKYQSSQADEEVLKGLLFVSKLTGDKESAKKYGGELVSNEPVADNYAIQIESYLDMGLAPEAEEVLVVFEEKYPENGNLLRLKAWSSLIQGRLEESLELINKDIESNPQNAVSLVLRGQVYLMTGKYGDAIIDFKRSKSLRDVPQTRLALSRAFISSGREEEAIIELRGLLDDSVVGEQASLLLEYLYTSLDRERALEELYEVSIEKYPDSVRWYNSAAGFAEKQKKFPKAQELYKAGFDKKRVDDGLSAAAFDGYLRALLAQDKYDEVFAYAGKYIDGFYAPMAYIKLCAAEVGVGDKQQAINYCRKAIEKAGSNQAYIATILQQTYSLLGYDQSLAVINQILSVSPDSLAANNAMFNLVLMKGDFKAAIGYLDKCLSISEAGSQAESGYILKKASVLYSLYKATSDKGYLTKMIEEYERAIEKMPNNTIAMNNIAFILADEGVRLNDALGYSEKVYELAADNPSYLDTYGFVLYKNKDYQKSVEMLLSSIKQSELRSLEASWEVYEHLAMSLEKNGEKEQAAEAYKKAIDKLSKGGGSQSEQAILRLKEALESL
ncbi:MAG: tetratricopeptide repeat protein [Phycisphaerae bacterium]|nr:tetratricopeptide repeat protein [Phycisphaerae bacterium]